MKKMPVLLVSFIVLFVFVYGCTNSDVERYNKAQEQKKNQKEQSPDITQIKLTYEFVEYEDLPADLKAMANLEPQEGFTKVVQGKGDNKYVFISLGKRNTGGYDIKIESIENVQGEINILYSETAPAPGDMVTQAITYPWKVIKIDHPLKIGKILKK